MTVARGLLKSQGTPLDFLGQRFDAPLDPEGLEGQSPFRALMALTTTRATALAGFRSETETIVLQLDDGRLRASWSTAESEDEALLTELFQSGAVCSHDLGRVAQHCDDTGEGLARTLYSFGLLAPAAIARALRSVYRQRVCRTATMESAHLTVVLPSETPLPTSSLISMDMNAILGRHAQQALKCFSWDDLEPALESIRSERLRLKDDEPLIASLDLHELHRDPMYRTLMQAHTLPEILEMAPMSAGEAARLVVTLMAFDLIEPVGASMITAPSMLAELDKVRTRLTAANHFVRLGAQWWAHLDELMVNYARLRERFGPNSTLRDGGPAGRMVETIWDMVEEAWGQVAEGDTRNAYRKSIVRTGRIERKADLLLEWARTAEQVTDNARAQRLYEVAAELRPSEAALEGLMRVRTELKEVV